jgi:predicted nucleic acid-binding protein
MPAVEAIFLDTNLLVYAHDRTETTKGPTAAALLTRLLTAGRPMVLSGGSVRDSHRCRILVGDVFRV